MIRKPAYRPLLHFHPSLPSDFQRCRLLFYSTSRHFLSRENLIPSLHFYLLLSSLHLLPRFPLYRSSNNEIIIYYVLLHVWFYFLVGLNECRLRHKGRKHGRKGRVRESSDRPTLTGFTGWLEKLGAFFTCPRGVENHGDGHQHTNTVRKRWGELVSADLTLPVFHENVGCLQTAEGKTLPDVLCTSCQPTVTDHCERSTNFQLYSDHTNVINEHKLNPTKIFCFYSIKGR